MAIGEHWKHSGDRVIYRQECGKMKLVAHPYLPNNANFVILWKGLDWSGFRTIAECVKQFPELENRSDASEDHFTVVER
jgi:hypothetical protein